MLPPHLARVHNLAAENSEQKGAQHVHHCLLSNNICTEDKGEACTV